MCDFWVEYSCGSLKQWQNEVSVAVSACVRPLSLSVSSRDADLRSAVALVAYRSLIAVYHVVQNDRVPFMLHVKVTHIYIYKLMKGHICLCAQEVITGNGALTAPWDKKKKERAVKRRYFLAAPEVFPCDVSLSLIVSIAAWSPPLIKMTAVSLAWSGVSKFAMLLFNLNNPTAYSARGDLTNSHSGRWGVQQWVTPSWLWKYITHNACHVVYESACVSVCVRALRCNHLSCDSYYNTEGAVCWRRREGKGRNLVLRFIGLTFRNQWNPVKKKKKKGGKCIEQKGNKKRGERAFSPSRWVVCSPERNLPIVINEKMEKRFPFLSLPPTPPTPLFAFSLPRPLSL